MFYKDGRVSCFIPQKYQYYGLNAYMVLTCLYFIYVYMFYIKFLYFLRMSAPIYALCLCLAVVGSQAANAPLLTVREPVTGKYIVVLNVSCKTIYKDKQLSVKAS